MLKSFIVITPLYASILAIIFVGLSFQVIRLRRRLKIGLGTGASLLNKNFDQGINNHQLILRAIRVHANFAEYVPLAMLLILCAEISGSPLWLLHILGLSLLIGRLSHAYGVSRLNEVFKYRVFGMVMTFTSILISAAFLMMTYIIH